MSGNWTRRMMDIYCQKCGESWDLSSLHELGSYGTAFLNGEGCPCCGMGEKAPEERPIRAEMMQIAREYFGDDLDGIAAELDDMESMGLLNEHL